MGVAHRGNIPLEDIHVDFGIEPVERPNGCGYGVRELVTLKGNLSDTERLRLERAARFCPVGQALNKGSVAVEDEVQWSSGEVTALSGAGDASGAAGLAGELPPVPAGTVRVKYLLDTKEYDAHGEMEHEGETKVSMECGNLTRTSRWMILAGHSSEGWVPSPFPLAQAAWAASTATTLQRLLPEVGEGGGHHIAVEMAFPPRGQRGEAQRNAAEGIVAPRPALRRVTVPGTPRTMPVELVQAALLRDPISQIYRDGGVLLDEQVVVE